MRRLVKCMLILVLIIALTISSASESSDMQTAYEELSAKNGFWGEVPLSAYDSKVWNDYDILVLDNGQDYPDSLSDIIQLDGNKNNFDASLNEYRYIGYTPDGYLVNNPRWPEDNPGTQVINSYNWQLNRDDKTRAINYITSPQEKTFYQSEIFHALEQEYGERFDETDDYDRWLNYAIVIVPATTTGDGVIKFRHLWDSDGDGREEDWYITVNLRAKDELVPISSSMNFGYIESEMTPLNATRIASDGRGSEEFDVTQGIPTGEELYVNVSASEYLHQETYEEVSGNYGYDVTVNKNYRLWRWNDSAIQIDLNGDGDFDDSGETTGDWESRIESVSKSYTVNRPFRFYLIDELDIYTLNSATISNGCINTDRISLNSSVQPPEIDMMRDEEWNQHLIPPILGYELSVQAPTEDIGRVEGNLVYPAAPDENLSGVAEAAVAPVRVRNDRLMINGLLVMDDTWSDESAPEPSLIPDATMNANGDLYSEGLLIEDQVENGLYESSGTIQYDLVTSVSGAAATIQVPIATINDVFVHTPVVCYPELDEISKTTQLLEVDESLMQLVIEETFTIDFPTSGMHRPIPGYGDRDYEEYTMAKQIRLPFDCYKGTDYNSEFISANSWFDFDEVNDVFFIPSWVKEESGYILFRTLANNIPSIDHEEYAYHANLDPTAFKAVEALPFQVSGKMESLSVTDCKDDFWVHKFKEHVLSIGEEDELALPLLPGKTYLKDGETNTLSGVMLGYPIEFEVTTNGELDGDEDYVFVDTSFSFVPDISGVPDTSLRVPVDLYVSEFGELGPYDHPMVLDGTSRELSGDIDEKESTISDGEKMSSVQTWTGRFHLPNMTYAVPAGTDLTSYSQLRLDKEPFLHNGFIVVNVELYTLNDHTLSSEIQEILNNKRKSYEDQARIRQYFQSVSKQLSYGNGWIDEGYRNNQLGVDLMIGDMIFYSTDRRASETYY